MEDTFGDHTSSTAATRPHMWRAVVPRFVETSAQQRGGISLLNRDGVSWALSKARTRQKISSGAIISAAMPAKEGVVVILRLFWVATITATKASNLQFSLDAVVTPSDNDPEVQFNCVSFRILQY